MLYAICWYSRVYNPALLKNAKRKVNLNSDKIVMYSRLTGNCETFCAITFGKEYSKYTGYKWQGQLSHGTYFCRRTDTRRHTMV